MAKRKLASTTDSQHPPPRRSQRNVAPGPTAPPPRAPAAPAGPAKPPTRDGFEQWHMRELGFGADVYYHPSFIAEDEARQWYDELVALDTYNPRITVYGKTITQSRAVAVYATTPGTSFKYSGAEIDVHYPLPPALRAMVSRVEAALGVQFNHVMLNRYDDGSVYIGRHSDTRDNVVIASLSVGAERAFVMTPRLPPKASDIVVPPERTAELSKRETKRWLLANGSLLVMQGTTQDFWKHEIPKEPKVKHGRISLTFRQLA